MATTTNYGWTTPDDTDLVKDGAAAIRTLGNSIDTTTKNLNPETTTGDIAYRSATANTNTRLPIGTNGQILAVSAGVPAWINNDQGDITEVQAGVGISIASGTGPVPVITNSSTDLIETAGDILYGTAADTVARLGIGTAGQVLKVNSGATAPEWAAASAPSFVGVAAYKAVTVSNNTTTAIGFDAEYFDTDAFHDNVTNNTRFTVPSGKAGYYLLTIIGEWQSNGTGQRRIEFWTNGNKKGTLNVPAVSGAFGMSASFVTDSLAVSDYVEVKIFQSSGGSLDWYMFSDGQKFTMNYLGA